MIRGSCLCGAVSFELDEPLTEIELCNCRKCRKAYGAATAATLYARASAFRWRQGEASVVRYTAPLEETPPAYRHAFCQRCGSPLPFSCEPLPLVEVPVALLDDPVDARPSYQMFESQRPAWSEGILALRGYPGGAPVHEKVLRTLL